VSWFHYPSLAGILLAATLPALPRRYAPLVVDQAAHLVVIVAVFAASSC